MIIKNVMVYTEDKTFKQGEIYIENGVFVRETKNKNEVLDGQGAYAIPGLIDIHLHGCMGYDFCDDSLAAMQKIAEYEASVGVTAICPATMTLPVENLKHILETAAIYKKQAVTGADLVGINMEGPFISPAKKGAQNEKYIIPFDESICRSFLEASEGLVKYIGIAPEENIEALKEVKQLTNEVGFSLAHTNADYDTAVAAIAAGVSHVVHFYNAMPSYSHRAPGVIGAVAESKQVDAELICDGIHIHPAAVRTAFQMLGKDRVVLISDSIRATGMPDGIYSLGGQSVNVKGKLATLISDSTIAGSVTNLIDCMRIAVKEMNLPLEMAVACATINAAKSIGIERQYGSITPGKKANVVLLEQNLDLMAVVKDGEKIK